MATGKGKNAGAAGIDRMTVEEFKSRAEELLGIIHAKLKAGGSNVLNLLEGCLFPRKARQR
jgi:hypothetical protein